MQCLASDSNSRRLNLETLDDGTNNSPVGEATSLSLAALYSVLQNLDPKSRWLSKVGEEHSLTEVNMHLCLQVGTNTQLKCPPSPDFHSVLPQLFNHFFTERLDSKLQTQGVNKRN